MERDRIALIGVGEAGRALAGGLPNVVGYDVLIEDPCRRDALLRSAQAAGIALAGGSSDAVHGARLILSLVTADQALVAAERAASVMASRAIFLDMNSVAPDTKRRAASIVDDAGGRYVDVAVMAPVLPARRRVPLLLSGMADGTREAGQALSALGFDHVRIIAGDVGVASAVKMVRSVLKKGMEALSAECAIAADAAGVLEEVAASLDASWPGADWKRRFDYNLDRMMAHGVRRAAEMEEAAATLVSLGVEPDMTRGTIARQRAIGSLGLTPPDGLSAKLATLTAMSDTPTSRSDSA